MVNSNNEEVESNTKIEEVRDSGVKTTLKWILYLIFFIYFTSKIIHGIPPMDSKMLGIGKDSIPWAIWLYALICFLIILGVKAYLKKNDGTTDNDLSDVGEDILENTSGWFNDFTNELTYLITTLFTYIFALSYLCMKIRFRNTESMYGGEGIVSDFSSLPFLKKGNNVANIDPSLRYALFMGVVLIVINCLSTIFMYLKNVNKYEKNEKIRNMYKSQVSALLIVIVSMVFLLLLGSAVDWNKTDSSAGEEIFKWIFVLVILLTLGIQINRSVDMKFFGINFF